MLTMLAEAAAADEDKKENGLDQKDCIRYNYGIVVESDIPEEAKQREMMDICQIACEKYAAAEKSPLERDNQAAAEMIKVTLGGSQTETVLLRYYLILFKS